jgi:hypothetical protein
VLTVSIGDELVQVAVLVTTCVVLSDIVAVATSEILSPAATEVCPDGEVVIAIDAGIAANTLTVVVAVVPIHFAWIVAVPAATAVTRPVVADTVAAVPLVTVHAAYPDMFTNVPLSNVAVAVICCVAPAASVGVAGDTLSPVKCPELTVSCVDAVTGTLDPLGV